MVKSLLVASCFSTSFETSISIVLKLFKAFDGMCYFDGTEGMLTVGLKAHIWCTVAGLICFLVSMKGIVPFFVVFNFLCLCKIHEHFYCLKLFLVSGIFFVFCWLFFAFKIPFQDSF